MISVSVIIPVYNVQNFLRQCLDSVVKQTLKDIEIICVDDGSTDSSLEILREYEKADNRIIILSQKNAGAGAARNAGLKIAKGKYLSFLDSDDFFEEKMLQQAYEKAEAINAQIVVFRSDQYHMDIKDYVPVSWTLRKQDIPPYEPFTYRQLAGNIFKTFVGWAWDKLYLRSFVEEKQLFFQEQRTSNDLLFVFSALIVAKRIAIVDEVLAHQRRGNGESLSVTREKSWQCFYFALKELKKRIIKEGLFWELEQDFVNYALHFSLWNLNTLAEPTHEILKQKLVIEWFADLGINGKSENYFYDKNEYKKYVNLRREK